MSSTLISGHPHPLWAVCSCRCTPVPHLSWLTALPLQTSPPPPRFPFPPQVNPTLTETSAAPPSRSSTGHIKDVRFLDMEVAQV